VENWLTIFFLLFHVSYCIVLAREAAHQKKRNSFRNHQQMIEKELVGMLVETTEAYLLA